MLTVRLLAAFARTMSGARPRWVGSKPEPTQRIYFANHTSHMDAIVIWSVLPPALRAVVRPVAAADYWSVGRVRRRLAIREFNAVLIDPTGESRERGESPVDVLVEAMGTRYSLILIPEDTRGSDPEQHEFRSGLYPLAQRRPDVELIPVYLSNLDRVTPRGAHVPVPPQCEVIFGPPLGRREGETQSDFLTRAREAVSSLKPR